MTTHGVLPPDGSGDEPHELEASMDLSELFGALTAPGTEDELAHADTAVAAMVAAHAQSAGVVVPLRSVNRRPALVAVGSVLGVMGAVLITGTAAAAFSGALPENLQRIAHEVLGAPAPTPLGPDSSSDGTDGTKGSGDGTSSRGPSEFTDTPSNNGSGPAATLDAKALFGLCTAFADNGPDDQNGESVAFQVLSEAASANNQTIEEFCGPILATKSPGKPTANPGSTNRPTAAPGSTKKPTVAPGSTRKPTVAPGSTKKPTSSTTDPGNRPSTPPGQTRKPSTSAR